MNHTEHTANDAQHETQVTLETGLWILIGVVALALRLSRLDAAPLNEAEAREALLAWHAVTGEGMPTGDYTPSLCALNALVFALQGGGASDAAARLWPALFGSLLALTPALLRRRIGRLPALAAGVYLALSPTALFASRQLDGAVMAAVGGMAFLGGLICFLDVGKDTGKRSWLILSAVGLALAVTSSPSAYGSLLTLALAYLCLIAVWPRAREDWSLSNLQSAVCNLQSLGPFLLAVFAFSTGLGWNLAGLGAAGGLLSEWIARFSTASNPAASPFAMLIVYEPLALSFGLGGLVWAVWRGHLFGVLLGLWAGLGTVLLALMPGRTPVDSLVVLLPLAMLAGVAVDALVRSARERGEWLSEGSYVLVVLILWGHLYLRLAHYADPGTWDREQYLLLALLTVVLQILLAAIFSLAMRINAALRDVALGTGIVLLALTLSAGWGVAYVRPADPRELLVREPTAPQVHDLVQTLRDLSWSETGMPTTLPFTLEAAPDSVLAWYLRDFSAARRVERADAERIGLALVTAQRELIPPAEVLGGAEFAGQSFVLRRAWDPALIRCTWERTSTESERKLLRCDAAVEWWLLRHTPSPPVADQWAVLWLRRDEESEVGD
jgi:uncharacterized protein (TIGR03663 family)